MKCRLSRLRKVSCLRGRSPPFCPHPVLILAFLPGKSEVQKQPADVSKDKTCYVEPSPGGTREEMASPRRGGPGPPTLTAPHPRSLSKTTMRLSFHDDGDKRSVLGLLWAAASQATRVPHAAARDSTRVEGCPRISGRALWAACRHRGDQSGSCLDFMYVKPRQLLVSPGQLWFTWNKTYCGLEWQDPAAPLPALRKYRRGGKWSRKPGQGSGSSPTNTLHGRITCSLFMWPRYYLVAWKITISCHCFKKAKSWKNFCPSKKKKKKRLVLIQLPSHPPSLGGVQTLPDAIKHTTPKFSFITDYFQDLVILKGLSLYFFLQKKVQLQILSHYNSTEKCHPVDLPCIFNFILIFFF